MKKNPLSDEDRAALAAMERRVEYVSRKDAYIAGMLAGMERAAQICERPKAQDVVALAYGHGFAADIRAAYSQWEIT